MTGMLDYTLASHLQQLPQLFFQLFLLPMLYPPWL